jgi:DNA-binding transcriptional MerR regulator
MHPTSGGSFGVRRTKLANDVRSNGLFTIGEVAECTGVKSYILRYWEKEFPFLQPVKNKAGHRLYSERDIQIVKSIKELLYERGYSISGAKKILLESLLGKKRKTLLGTIEEIKRELKEALDAVKNSLKGA